MVEVVSIRELKDSVVQAAILSVTKERILSTTISRGLLLRSVSTIIEEQFGFSTEGMNRGTFSRAIRFLKEKGVLIPDEELAQNHKKNPIFRVNIKALRASLEEIGDGDDKLKI